MANKVYGQFVISNDLLEKTKKILADAVDDFEVLEEHESTFEDMLDATKLRSLSSYIASHRLYTTIVFSYKMNDWDYEALVHDKIW